MALVPSSKKCLQGLPERASLLEVAAGGYSRYDHFVFAERMIHVIRTPATPTQIEEMREAWDTVIKVAVDVRRGILSGGGHLHSDCEEALLATGSSQEDVWAAQWIPDTGDLLFDSIVNIRPRQGNRTTGIEDPALRARLAEIVHRLLGGA
jgi:hypothetical protein